MGVVEKIKNEILGIAFLGLGGYISYILIKGLETAQIGFVGENLRDFLFFLIGDLSYILPLIFFLYSAIFIFNREVKISKIKLYSFLMFFLLIASLMVISKLNINELNQTIGEAVKQILRIGGNKESGGMLGAMISVALFTLFGKNGAIIIIATLMLINLMIFGNSIIKKILKNIQIGLTGSKTEGKKRKLMIKKKTTNNNKESEIDIENEEEKNRKESKDNKRTKGIKPKGKQEEKVIVVNKENDFFDYEEENKIDTKEEFLKKKVKNKELEKNKLKIESNKIEEKKKVENRSEKVEELFESKKNNEDKTEEIKKATERKIEDLEDVLNEYGIEAKVVNYERGPVITRFELSVSKGTRVKRIVALTDDIAMNLEAKSIRIEAPIPGKNAIGIEIPNEIQGSVYFSNAIKDKKLKKNKSPIEIILGKNIIGENVTVNLGKMPHLLIAGRTGSGKSVCINTLISSIISRATADEVRFIMVDPKMVELMPYNEIPHLLVPVITQPKQAAIALKWAVNEMEDRYKKLSELGVRNLEGYNKKVGEEKLPFIIVIIDELADLMMVAPSTVEESISRIAQKARAIGIHLVVATQRPSTDVVTGTIKANLPSRISFAVASQIDSRTILDTPGAEKLLGRGDLLFLESGSPNLVRIQGAFISDEEVEKLTAYLKEQGTPQYNNDIINETLNKETDELYEDAIDVIRENGKISISLIQRKLKVGYARAARIVDELQENGIVTEDREILIDI